MEDWRRSRLEELNKETKLKETTTRNGNMNGDGDGGHHGRTELKKTSTSRVRCSAVNCKHYVGAHPELAFHRFPRDTERCSKWLQILGNPSLANISFERLSNGYRVCSAHFHPSQFKRKTDVHAGLNWDAVPSGGDAPNPPFPQDSESGRKQPILHQELPPNKSKQNCDAHQSRAVDSYTTDHDQKPILSELTVPGKVKVRTRHPKPMISLLPPLKTSLSPLPRPTMLQTRPLLLWTPLPMSNAPQPLISPLPKTSQSPLPRSLPTMLQMQPLQIPQSTSRSLLPMSNTSEPKTSQSPLPRSLPTMLQMQPLQIPQSTSQSLLPMSNTSEPKTSEPEPESAVREIALKREIRNLQAQVSKLKTKVRVLKGRKNGTTTVAITKKSVLQLMKKLLSATAYKFFRAQLNVAQRNAHGFRWTDEDKVFFLDLLRASPQCYRLMTDIFSMPSIRTLQRLMKPTDFKPGVDKNIVTSTTEVEETTQPVAEVCAAVAELERTNFL